MDNKVILDERTMMRTLARLSHEIIEHHPDESTLCLVGIKRRGVPLAGILKENIEKYSDIEVLTGELDITLYRDDLTEKADMPLVSGSVIPFDIRGKNIVLVDDVIYTGRTVRAAMEALMGLGRPARIELLVMVDRGHRELPIAANYVGKNIPTSKSEFISVRVKEIDGVNEVVISRRDQ